MTGKLKAVGVKGRTFFTWLHGEANDFPVDPVRREVCDCNCFANKLHYRIRSPHGGKTPPSGQAVEVKVTVDGRQWGVWKALSLITTCNCL